MLPSITVLTYTPSPYQVELFDEVASTNTVDLQVLYLHSRDREREWSEKARSHVSLPLDDGPSHLDEAKAWVRTADLFVLSYYQDATAMAMLNVRLAGSKPWAFWGERTGFRHPILGRLLRRWSLRALHGSKTPIWGIGQWAVDAYKKEFGQGRGYVDLPYFSNLARFHRASPPPSFQPFTFLYSGALVRRKGVDLLAQAFSRLVTTHPHVHLQFLGSGPEEARLREDLEHCRDHVTFLGFRDWPSLPSVYHGAHVLCVPSRHDGWALVVPEGLASGLPVIGTDRTGAALEFIKDGQNGWLIPADNGESLYEALRRAADLSMEGWQTMSTAASASVARHTLAEGAQRFVHAAEEALQGAAA